MPESLREDPSAPVEVEEDPAPTVLAPEEDADPVSSEGPAGPTSQTGPTGQTSQTSPTDPTDPAGRVVINEIYYDALGSDTDGVLFVELYGTPGLGLAGCKIVFVNGDNGMKTDSITLPEDAGVGEDGFYLIADSRDGLTAVTQVAGAGLIDNFDPQNGPDAVQLLDAEGELLDVIAYGEVPLTLAENGFPLVEGSPAPDVTSGHSLERIAPGEDTDDNFADFAERELPTSGY